MNLRSLVIFFGLMMLMPVRSDLVLAQQANATLKGLIESARKEGQLDLMITSGELWGQTLISRLSQKNSRARRLAHPDDGEGKGGYEGSADFGEAFRKIYSAAAWGE